MTAASNFDGLPGGWLSARRTLVLVGHLPVMSGLWLSQYADREAREGGSACLVRLAADSVQLELFRAGSRRPAIRPQATCEEALRTIAPIVSHWLIVPQQAERIDIPKGTDDIVVLTGADQAAIVAAYRLVKSAHEACDRLGGTRPSISVAVIGADATETAHVAARIGEASGTSLGVQIPVRGGLQRVAPAESSFRGTFDESAPSLERICEIIASAGSSITPSALGGALEPPAAARSAPEAHTASTAPEPLRFSPRADRRPPMSRGASEPIPFRSEPPPRGGRGTDPVRTPPARVAPAADSVAAISMPAAAAPSPSLPPSPSRAAPAPREMDRLRATIEGASQLLREARDEQAPPSRGPYHASAVSGPSVAPPIARSTGAALPDSLVAFVAGLTRIDHFAPRCERVEFAIDDAGRLHLVCRAEDLRMLERARAWLAENGGLFRRAYPEAVDDAEPHIDLFVQDISDISPVAGATLHLMRQLEFGGRRFFDLQTIPA